MKTRDAAFIAAQWHAEQANKRGELDAMIMFVDWQIRRLGLRGACAERDTVRRKTAVAA